MARLDSRGGEDPRLWGVVPMSYCVWIHGLDTKAFKKGMW